MQKISFYLEKLLDDILLTSLITFIIYLALENFKTGLISNYFDLNLLLIIAGFLGIVILLLKNNTQQILEKKLPFTLFLIFIIIYLLLIYLILDINRYLELIIVVFLLFSFLIYYKKHDKLDKN